MCSPVELLLVHLAEDSSRCHHIEEAHNDAGILTSQITHCVSWIG